MAYVTPTSKTTGDLIAATDWNQNTVDNPIAIRTGGIAISSQAANDVIYASSSTQLARLPAGTAGQVLATQGAGSAPSWIDQSQGLRQSFRGLTLRTHPDADVAASKVFLDHADEIVLNDGTRVADWDDLTANITVSGAGGLDTGSEGASRWYEIHAIRKSSDGTKNLLLHRAKDYFLDEQNTTSATTSALRDASAQTKRAQTFDTDVTGPVEFAEMKLTKVGSPTGQIWVSIYATSGGLPTGAALKTSDKLDVSLVSTSAQVVRFIFRDPQTVTAGTTYALVLEGNFTISGVNYLSFDRSTTDPYAAGQLCAYDGATWTGSAVDAWFKVYVTENDTALTLPSGYDQYALIGWVYNDSGSDLDPFVAKDRIVCGILGIALNSSTVSIPTLADISVSVPPVPVYVHLSVSANSAGPVYALATAQIGAVHNRMLGTAPTDWSQDVPGINIEFQFLYGYRVAGVGSLDLRVPGYTW